MATGVYRCTSCGLVFAAGNEHQPPPQRTPCPRCKQESVREA